jgi:hypothetical protein
MMRDGDAEAGLPLNDALPALRRPEEPPGELEERIVERLVAAGGIATGGVVHDRTVRTPAGGGVHAHAAVRRPGRASVRSRNRSTWLRAAAAALAGIALFSAGVVAGARTGATPPDGPRYALLLLPGPEFVEAAGAAEAERVAEYGAWAGRLAAAERLVLAEKLGETVGTVGAGGLSTLATPAPTDQVLGFFIIVAQTDAEALAAARESPHAAAGGRVAVIRIDPT